MEDANSNSDELGAESLAARHLPAILSVNVGGVVYNTTEATLRGAGFFDTLLNTEIPTSVDEKGRIFVDRDGKLFEDMLSFLRNKQPVQSSYPEHILLTEADFYQIKGFSKHKPVVVPHSIVRKEIVQVHPHKTKKKRKLYYLVNPYELPDDLRHFAQHMPNKTSIDGIEQLRLWPEDLSRLKFRKQLHEEKFPGAEDEEDYDVQHFFVRSVRTEYADSSVTSVVSSVWDKVTEAGSGLIEMVRYE